MSITARAAVLTQPGAPLTLADIDLADPGPAQVLVRIKSTGICGTDLHFAAGLVPYPVPTVLGHEAAGIVEAVGPGVASVRPGDRVIVCDQTFCGRCAACLSGQMVYCTDTGPKQRQRNRLRIGGERARQYLGVSSFAELVVVDENALTALPPELSFDDGALLSCCLTTGLAAVFNIARPVPGDRVAVFGCGGVGLGVVQAARIAGASQIIAVDPQPHRRDLALTLGATDAIDPGDGDIIAAVIDRSSGGVRHAVEAVGTPATALAAFSVLLPGGHAVVLGMLPAGTDVALPARLLRGRTLTGTTMGAVRTPADIPRYAELVRRGLLHTTPLVTSHRPLTDINDALADAAAHCGVRTVIAF